MYHSGFLYLLSQRLSKEKEFVRVPNLKIENWVKYRREPIDHLADGEGQGHRWLVRAYLFEIIIIIFSV